METEKGFVVMRYKIIWMGLILLWICFFAGSHVLAADFKSAELQRKVEEIASLRMTVTEKVERAVRMREQLAQLMEGYAQEIRREKSRWRYESYRNAVGNPRIAYDLQLVQQLQAYIVLLDDRIAYFRQAGQVLEFYFRQINDDLLMIRTLDHFEVDQLIAKINDALDEYVAASIKKTVHVDELQLKDSEIIWQELVAVK